MASERVARQQEHVRQQKHAAHTDADSASKVKRDDGAEPQEGDLDHRGVEGVPMEVVEHPGKHGFAAISPSGALRHRTRSGMPEKASEVGLAVVVAREAKNQWRPRDPESGWNRSHVDER